jgi:hypothetical protein
MADNETIHFAFVKIETDEFAMPDSPFDPTMPVEMKTILNFGFFKNETIIKIQSKCEFYQKDKLALVIAVSCHFKIEMEDWKSIYSETQKTFTLSRMLAVHFAGLTVGVARGVLHGKTEKTIFEAFVLPPVNLLDFVKEDLISQEVPAVE